MLSIQGSVFRVEVTVALLTVLHSAHADVPLLMNAHSMAGPPGVLPDFALKSDFPFTSQVLRI
jgi:hypothetical protein